MGTWLPSFLFIYDISIYAYLQLSIFLSIIKKYVIIMDMELQKEIDDFKQKFNITSEAISIGEWINLYQNSEVIIPESKLNNTQKTLIIEGALLGIPASIVTQCQDGIFIVVNGVEILSTIFEFVGIKNETFVLEKTTFLPSLEGKKWNDVADPNNSLTRLQRLLIKRSKINVLIIE